MTVNNKILPVALVAALLGATVGAFVMRPSKQAETPQVAQTASPLKASTTEAAATTAPGAVDPSVQNADLTMTDREMAAYREGFNDGVKAAQEAGITNTSQVSGPTRTRTRYVTSGGSSRRVYYDYGQQPKGRSFWQKHRDKLTVAMGAGGGAIIGGLVGGKKGAAIGALAGGGGSALYTYKLRNRNRNY
jgi:hypothetical protein